MESFKRILERAEEAGACRSYILELKEDGSLKKALNNRDPSFHLWWYSVYVLGKRQKWIEKQLLKAMLGTYTTDRDPYYLAAYARDIIQGRWEEAEEFIFSDPKTAEEYIRICKEFDK